MITKEQLQKIGIPGLLMSALIWLNFEYQGVKEELKVQVEYVQVLQADKNKFVEMIINTYHIPLVK